MATFSRSFVIEECAALLQVLKGTASEDDDGTLYEHIDNALALCKPYPDVLKRFLAAVAKTEWRVH